MPIDWKAGTPAAAPGGVNWNPQPTAGDVPVLDEEETAPASEPGINPLAIAAGAAGTIGAGLLAAKLKSNPSAVKAGVSKVLEYLNAARMTSMLSGLAPLKSALGGVGAVVQEGAERASSLKDFGRRVAEARPAKLYRDYKTAMKLPANPAYGVKNPIGSRMGALDTAFQKALQRGGLTAQEAEKAMMQAPLDGRLGAALDSDAARYLIPFRRTPLNQVIEGFEHLKGVRPGAATVRNALDLGTAATGLTHGAATADERYPQSVGLGTAAAGKRGVLYAISALGGRTLAGGSEGSGIAQTMTPISDFGIEQGIAHPIKSLNPANSAGANLLRKLGLLPTQE